MSAYTPEYLLLRHFHFTDIVYDDFQTCATVYGMYKSPDGDYLSCDLMVEFNLLADMLLCTGKKGDKILKALAKNVLQPMRELPATIDVREMNGEPLGIGGAVLKVYKPHVQQPDGSFKESNDEWYQVARVIPEAEFRNLQRAQKAEAELQRLYTWLDGAYQRYTKLCETAVPKDEARYCAGLRDVHLFRIAHLRHKIAKGK